MLPGGYDAESEGKPQVKRVRAPRGHLCRRVFGFDGTTNHPTRMLQPLVATSSVPASRVFAVAAPLIVRH